MNSIIYRLIVLFVYVYMHIIIFNLLCDIF